MTNPPLPPLPKSSTSGGRSYRVRHHAELSKGMHPQGSSYHPVSAPMEWTNLHWPAGPNDRNKGGAASYDPGSGSIKVKW